MAAVPAAFFRFFMKLFENQAREFEARHLGPNDAEQAAMLQTIGVNSIDELMNRTVPAAIRMEGELDLPASLSESDYLRELKNTSLRNQVFRNYIGQGYYDILTPSVILRNVFENPGWYTQYTPYQAEISQGRLESLLNYQTMVADLTGLPIANASLLDEGTAAAEAMSMFFNAKNKSIENPERPKFFVDEHTFPQTKAVVLTRAEPLKIEVVFGDFKAAQIDDTFFGALVQYPNDKGGVEDYSAFVEKVHSAGAYIAFATDLMALTLLKTPGEMDADVALGNSQRFGVPLGYGGPHAAFFATKDEFKRAIPGRIIGVSVDASGNRALRMALQTREQHIKREKATSNICTAQALLANMAALYAVYHGPEGLKNIARRISVLTHSLAEALRETGVEIQNDTHFDTLWIKAGNTQAIREAAEEARINLRYFGNDTIGISLDETTTLSDVSDLAALFGKAGKPSVLNAQNEATGIPEALSRTSAFLQHDVFNRHRSETQMMRYLRSLEGKDLSLNWSMIPLGSCTMKLNAATEMMPLSWSHWSKMHPYMPHEQAGGYKQIATELERYLSVITGFDACSLQPNSGAQGEYAGLLAIRNYHEANGQGHRDIMLIPISAHGTNPASAVMAGYKVVVVKALENGYIDVEDLKAKATQYADRLAGIMITYPSTYGVYEETVKDINTLIHELGGQVYMDGANMNAQVGLTAPGLIGADVCHLNLHKTFAIPHGGGGPGMGPICVKKHLEAHLPSPSPALPQGEGAAHPHTSTDSGVSKLDTAKGEGASQLHAAKGEGDFLNDNNNKEDATIVTLPLGEVPIAIGRGGAVGSLRGAGMVSSAPYGSASILLISYAYIRLLGARGLRKATETAILNANYMRARLEGAYDILYTGSNGTCAHEFIADLRPFKKSAGIEAEDVAKRLMDYGFHAPTLSFPVPGTIMIEPTESEDKAELDRFCEAMLSIREEIRAIEDGKADKTDNPLKNAPHTQWEVCGNDWNHAYSREEAAFPLAYVAAHKFWPSVKRVNNTAGDRNLICTCEPTAAYLDAQV